MEKIVELEINKLIKEILYGIYNKNIDMLVLCDALYLEPEEFVRLINYPKLNISTYYEILTVIDKI